MNASTLKTQSSAARGWWWHPHLTDSAAQAISADTAGGWWWHPHTTDAGDHIDI